MFVKAVDMGCNIQDHGKSMATGFGATQLRPARFRVEDEIILVRCLGSSIIGKLPFYSGRIIVGVDEVSL